MRVNLLLLICGSCMLMSANCSKKNNYVEITPSFKATIDGIAYDFPYGVKAIHENTFIGPTIYVTANRSQQGINLVSIMLGNSDPDPAQITGDYSASGRRNYLSLAVSTDTSTVAFFGDTHVADSLVQAAGITDYTPFKMQITESTSSYIKGTFSGDIFWKGIPGMSRKKVTAGSFQANYK